MPISFDRNVLTESFDRNVLTRFSFETTFWKIGWGLGAWGWGPGGCGLGARGDGAGGWGLLGGLGGAGGGWGLGWLGGLGGLLDLDQKLIRIWFLVTGTWFWAGLDVKLTV